MDYDASVPLPDSVVREMSPFHRLMRSHLIGLVLWLSAALVLAVQPLFAVAPVLLLLAWLGVVDVGLMQRFFDYTSGWYIAILMVRTRVGTCCAWGGCQACDCWHMDMIAFV